MDLFDKHSNTNELWTNLSKDAPVLDYLAYYQQGKLNMPTQEQLICETRLLALGDYFPLNIHIDTNQLRNELEEYKDKWTLIFPVKIELTIEKDFASSDLRAME